MRALVCLALLASTLALAQAEIRYNVINLDVLTGYSCAIQTINNSNQVLGRFTSKQADRSRTFLYAGGTFTDLGIIGPRSDYVIDINDSGQIVGKFQDEGFAEYVYLWSAGKITNLGVMGGAWIQAINNHGDLLGFRLQDHQYRPFVYRAGNMTDMTTALGGDVNPVTVSDFNDSGDLAGYMLINHWNHAFIYSGGTMIDIAELGLPSNAISYTFAVNNSGDVVGAANFTSDTFQPFLYSNGTLTNLDPNHSFSVARSINDQGQIVGNFEVNAQKSAFLYENGSLTVLRNLISPHLPYRLEFADKINNSGWILSDGYVLVPIDRNVPVPELAPMNKTRLLSRKPRIEVSGIARGKVTSVSYRLGARQYQIAKGTNRWLFTINLRDIKRAGLTIVAHGPGGESTPIRIPVLVQ